MAYDVFISYSSKDKAVADAVCVTLEGQGIKCWIAPRDIVPGTDWGASIVHGIAEARVFVLVFSSSANTSPQIKREVERAVNRGIPVIPLRVEDAKPSDALEFFISTPHWLDAFPPPLDNHLKYLSEVVRGILLKEPPAGDAADSPPTAGPATRSLPFRRPPRQRALIYAFGGAVPLLVLAAGAWFGLQLMQPKAPVEAACLVKVEEPSEQVCADLLAHNAQWQDCSVTFAAQDMQRAIDRAMQLLRKDEAASVVYYDPRFYGKAYGTLSHYWEMFGECVNENFLTMEKISSGVSFPEVFWNKTRPLRELFLDNWAGPNKALPDFMSNFHDLCVRYKAQRNTDNPGAGDTLDCTL